MTQIKASAADIISKLDLKALPQEGGFFRETSRETGMSCIYYLITQESFSALHSLRSSEMWHFYAGDPAQMIQISPSGQIEKYILGANVIAGQRPQCLVPSHFFQGTRLLAGGEWALFGCTVSPAFDSSHYIHGDKCELIKKYPHLFDFISRYSNT